MAWCDAGAEVRELFAEIADHTGWVAQQRLEARAAYVRRRQSRRKYERATELTARLRILRRSRRYVEIPPVGRPAELERQIARAQAVQQQRRARRAAEGGSTKRRGT